MLKDSAHLQQRDIEWLNKKRKNKNQAQEEALYSLEDVERALNNFIKVEYNTVTEIFSGINVFRMPVTFYDIFLN
jgi:metallo-beta-lactamase family protein